MMIPNTHSNIQTYSTLLIADREFKLEEYELNTTYENNPFFHGGGSVNLPHFRPLQQQTNHFDFTIVDNNQIDFFNNISTIGENVYIISSDKTHLYELRGLFINNVSMNYDYEWDKVITRVISTTQSFSYYTDKEYNMIENKKLKDFLKQELRIKKLKRIINEKE